MSGCNLIVWGSRKSFFQAIMLWLTSIQLAGYIADYIIAGYIIAGCIIPGYIIAGYIIAGYMLVLVFCAYVMMCQHRITLPAP